MRAVFGGTDQIRAPEIQRGHFRRREDLPAATSDRFADEFLVAIHFGRVEEAIAAIDDGAEGFERARISLGANPMRALEPSRIQTV